MRPGLREQTSSSSLPAPLPRCLVEHDASCDARIQRFNLRCVRDCDELIGLRQHCAGQACAFVADEKLPQAR